MSKGTHDYVEDPRNLDIQININGEYFPRNEARVSVFDSGFILGDGVWEGLRLHRVMDTCSVNNMDSGVHIRLMVTRGEKSTPYQDPRVTISPPTIVIIPEYKNPNESTLTDGIRLFTVHVRRGN